MTSSGSLAVPISGQVDLRPFRAGDEGAVNAAFNRVFGLERPLAEWHWKFPAEPEGRWILLAMDAGGEVQAHYAAVPARFQVDGRVVRAGQVVDAFCRRRSGLARQGLFAQTVEHFFESFGSPDRLALLYGFPGTRHLQLGLARMGYGQPVPVAYWTREAALPPAPSGGRFRVRTGFDPGAVDRLWRRAAGRYPVAVVRDGAWLGRRFAGRPGVTYLHVGVFPWLGRSPRAWGVLRARGETVSWAELIWDGRDPRALAALEVAIAEATRGAGVQRIEAWLAGDEAAAAVLAGRGWQRRDQPDGLHLTLRSFDPKLDSTDLAGRFYLTMGDADLV
jgi:Acetyltransferase (GNAT) domain